MSWMVTTAIALFVVALALLAVELLVPSGVIAITAAVCAVAGIVLLFKVDTTYGMISAIVTLVGSPFIVGMLLKIWPHTPIGRMLIHRDSLPAMTIPTPREQDSDEDDAPEEPQVLAAKKPSLVGATGQALTDLRPGGIAIVNQQRLDVLSDAGMIRAGTKIRVVAEDGMEVKVREEA